MTFSSRRRGMTAVVIAAALISLAGCSVTQPAGPEQMSPLSQPAVPGGTIGLGITGLIVSDIPTSLTFYRQLGLNVPENVDTEGGAVRFRMPNNTIFVWETVAYTQEGFDKTYQPMGTGDGDRKVTLEFGFNSADEVDAMYIKLVRSGTKGYQQPVSWYGGSIRFAMVVDPDGNRIGLRWPLAS